MKAKRWLAVFTAAAVTMGMATGCGKDTSETGGGTDNQKESTVEEEGVSELAGTKISFLNSKGEIQSALEDMAITFEEETGIAVDIMACGTGEVPYTKITSAYNSGAAPTMAMLDTTDIVALAEEYAIDLSEENWVKECEDQITRVNDKIYSFPFCVEGRGLIYNKKAIENTLGTDFDPESINSYDTLKELLENLRTAGMENPVVLSKEDWSLGAHQLGYIYDTYDGTTEGSAEVIKKLKDGSLKAGDYERFNQFVDTFDLLMEYNINGNDPLGALYEQDPIYLADEEAAIWANGCWAWPNIEEAGASKEDEYGFLSFFLGNDTSDFANTGIQVCATKQVMIDGVQATDTEIAAAKEFLNWIVYSESGQKMLVEQAALIPACKNNANVPLDPLGKDIQSKMVNRHIYSSSFIAPSDHWSVMGAAMQKYLAEESSRKELAASLDAYWTSQN